MSSGVGFGDGCEMLIVGFLNGSGMSEFDAQSQFLSPLVHHIPGKNQKGTEAHGNLIFVASLMYSALNSVQTVSATLSASSTIHC